MVVTDLRLPRRFPESVEGGKNGPFAVCRKELLMTSFTLAHDLFDSVAVLGACCSSSVPICAYMCQGFFPHLLWFATKHCNLEPTPSFLFLRVPWLSLTERCVLY